MYTFGYSGGVFQMWIVAFAGIFAQACRNHVRFVEIPKICNTFISFNIFLNILLLSAFNTSLGKRLSHLATL